MNNKFELEAKVDLSCTNFDFTFKMKIFACLKFMFFKKATKIDEIFTVNLTLTT